MQLCHKIIKRLYFRREPPRFLKSIRLNQRMGRSYFRKQLNPKLELQVGTYTHTSDSVRAVDVKITF